MTDKQSRTGRTFWDWISDNPKTAIFFLLVTSLIIVSLVYMNKPIEIGPLKINQQEKVIHDTITKFKSDTQVIYKPLTQIKFNKPPLNTQKEVLVKKGLDTVISVKNQPANINTGTNNGIIGNDNKISLKSIPRELNSEMKKQLLALGKDEKINVNSLANDAEAYGFGTNIINFLKENGYKKLEMRQAFFSPPIVGQTLRRDEKNEVLISIGSNP